MKNELDLSELMHNFLKHRFQIALDQSIDNPSKYSLGNEINYNEQFIKSKEEIKDICEKEYNLMLNNERQRLENAYKLEIKNLRRQNEEKSAIIEDLTNQISELSATIKGKNMKKYLYFRTKSDRS